MIHPNLETTSNDKGELSDGVLSDEVQQVYC